MLHIFPKEEYQREYNILKSLLPNGIYHILRRLNVRVAGGTLTSLFSNRDVNDIDLYFPSWENLEVFLAYMDDKSLRCGASDLTPFTNNWANAKRSFNYFYELDNPGEFKDYTNSLACGKTERPPTQLSKDKLDQISEFLRNCSDDVFERIKHISDDDKFDTIENLGMTDKSVMFTNRRTPVLQCIAFDVFDSAMAIFDKFDFTINMGSFSFASEKWEFDKNFLKHIAQKVLVLNPKTDYPIISMLRADKYRARGYTISRRETMKLGVAASGLSIETWEDAKAHLSGMYGTNVEELFNEKRPFSFDLLFDKLDSAGDKIISAIATDSEKGGKGGWTGLEEVNIFTMYQKLRMNTGRKYFTKLWAVCPSENFYLMVGDKHRHKVGMFEEKPAAQFLSVLKLYVDEKEAWDVYKSWGEKGRTGRYGDRISEPGAVLLEVSVSDPLKIDYIDAKVFIHDAETTLIKIDKMIECNGEIS